MKKFITLILCSFTLSIFSQTDSIKKETAPVLNNVSKPGDVKVPSKYLPFNFGPRIGVALTQLSKDDFYGRQWKPVINAGAFFNYEINKYFSIGTEVYFTQHAKNYDCMTKSNLIPKMLNNLYAFGLDTTLVNTLLGGVTSGIGGTTLNDTIYSYTRGTLKMSTLEVPLMVNFHYQNFKFTGGAYAAFMLSSTTNEEYRDKVPLLDLIGPTLDTLINTVLGGGSGTGGFDLASFIIDPAAPHYKKAYTSSSGTVTDLKTVMFGYLADISYTFSNNINLGVRINYPWMTYKPNVNVAYVRNTQYSASLSYLFRLKRNHKGSKTKALNTQ